MDRLGNLVALGIGAAIASIASSAFAAPRSACDSLVLPPVTYISCYDREIAALADEVDSLYRQAATGVEPSARNVMDREQKTWSGGLAARCNLPNAVFAPDALKARPCLVREHVGRLRELAKHSVSSGDRLHDRPSKLTTKNIDFTFVASFDTSAEALYELAHLRKNFPFLSFDLYPPHPSRKDWRIAFASYVDKAHADKASDLALVLGASLSPSVWNIPEPLSAAGDWQACKPSPFGVGKMICNGQQIDSGPTDVPSASAYLADRLNDRPANITSASSYFTIVRSLESKDEAQRQLNALMTRFPSVHFSLYPPYGKDKNWSIVIASYTGLERANKALELATWLGMGQDAHIWQLPQPFNVPEGWLPEDIQHVVLGCLQHGAQTIMDMYTCSGSVLRV